MPGTSAAPGRGADLMNYRPASAVLKREIEAQLASRIPGALSAQSPQSPRLLSTGVPAIDQLLGGGLPMGGLSEIAGEPGSGRTSVSLSVLAVASQEAACAYVDVGDYLDPGSAAAAGLRLENLLWVRLSSVPAQASAGLQPVARPCAVSEIQRDSQELRAMLAQKSAARRAKQEGTPGHPNRPLSPGLGLAAAPEEQVCYERLFERGNHTGGPQRAQAPQAAVWQKQAAQASARSAKSAKFPSEPEKKPWSLLDQAIRATDQILQSGGFRVVVLDLASVLPEQALRIPAATWFRFRKAAQASDAILLVLTRQSCVGSSAACTLAGLVESVAVSDGLLRKVTYSVEIARQRFAHGNGKKAPGRVAAWQAVPQWMRAAGS